MTSPENLLKKQPLALIRGQHRLHYTRFGEGSQPLLAFHGFGQSKEHLNLPGKILSQEYTVYAFDLFYHGDNAPDYPAQPLTKAEWKAWMQLFFEQETVKNCSVLGFSLGGRFAMATAEAFPDQVKELLLVAPDGIKKNVWYALATSTRWSRSWFKRIVYQPRHFQRLARLVRAFRLSHPKLIRFAQSQMDMPEKQVRLYYSWTNFRRLSFNIPALAILLNRKSVRTEVFVGKYDRLLSAKDAAPFTRRLTNGRLTVLDYGHSQLLERTAAYLADRKKLEK